jgi:hypothetical protein
MKLTNKQALTAYNEVFEAFVSNEPLPVNAVNLLVYSIQDLQVRDYLLGHAPISLGVTRAIEFVTAILPLVEEGERAPFYSVMSAWYYEAGDKELAFASLMQSQLLNPDYSLSKLLNRVFQAGWDNNAFATMRSELHPKVEANFAEEMELEIA